MKTLLKKIIPTWKIFIYPISVAFLFTLIPITYGFPVNIYIIILGFMVGYFVSLRLFNYSHQWNNEMDLAEKYKYVKIPLDTTPTFLEHNIPLTLTNLFKKK